MRTTDWFIIAIIVVLFLVSTVLSLAETAFTRVNRIRVLALAEEGNKRARRLMVMLDSPVTTLNSVLLVLLAAQLGSATLVGVLMQRLLGPIGVAVGTFIEVAVFFVFAEVA